jgi:MoaA/NifB/PqqE/SkfB family radical SAM enzyme
MPEIQVMFRALAKAKIFYATITGGEPMLYPALLVEAVRLCAENGISCSVNSNLTVATEKLILEMREAGPFTLLTSIASSDESVHDAMMGHPGAFRRTLKGIDILRRQGISIGVNMVVGQLNAEHVYSTGLLAHELGAKSFSATKASPPLGCVDYSAIRPTPSQVKASLDALIRLHEKNRHECRHPRMLSAMFLRRHREVRAFFSQKLLGRCVLRDHRCRWSSQAVLTLKSNLRKYPERGYEDNLCQNE